MDFQAIVSLGKDTWQEFQEDDAQHMSAALSYYFLFSLFPLLLLLVAVIGFVLRYVPAAQGAEAAIVEGVSANFSSSLADIIGQALAGVREQAGTATGIGLVTLLLGASGVFQQLDDSFNKIWNVPKPEGLSVPQLIRQFITQKLTSFAMVLAVGFLLIVSAVLTGLTQVILNGATAFLGVAGDSWLAGAAGFVVGTLVALLLNTLIFALLFKFLPDAKISWRDIWPGAIATAILWEIGKRVLAVYIGSIGAKSAAYGAIGSVLVLVAWIYFSSLILYLGAEFTQVYTKRFGSHAAAAPQPEPEQPTEQDGTLSARDALDYNRSVRKATGRGFVVGAIGGGATALIALLAAVFFAVTSVLRLFRKPARVK